MNIILTFFYSGLSPIAPGTCGSLLAMLFWPLWFIFPKNIMLIFYIIFMIYSLYILYTSWKNKLWNGDPKYIVIDEALAVLLIPFISTNIYDWLFCWLLFRIFDIFKPFPISWVEKNTHEVIAIFLDDYLACFFAIVFTVFIF